ncbi:MAG: cell division protein ZapA [Mediterranea sp.]|jgi:cell division protein ZapA|nr:cell division protein ZapA [Mediterranea sp.]
MDDKIKINLKIAGNSFAATTERKREEMARKAAKEVDVQFNELMNKYDGKLSKERAIAIVAYNYALESLLLREGNDTEPYDQKVMELTKVLENCIKGE